MEVWGGHGSGSSSFQLLPLPLPIPKGSVSTSASDSTSMEVRYFSFFGSGVFKKWIHILIQLVLADPDQYIDLYPDSIDRAKNIEFSYFLKFENLSTQVIGHQS